MVETGCSRESRSYLYIVFDKLPREYLGIYNCNFYFTITFLIQFGTYISGRNIKDYQWWVTLFTINTCMDFSVVFSSYYRSCAEHTSDTD